MCAKKTIDQEPDVFIAKEVLHFRVTEDEALLIAGKAEDANMTLSAFVRKLVVDTLRGEDCGK